MPTARFRESDGTVRIGEWTGETIVTDERPIPVSSVEVLPPTAATKILGVGPNYYSNVDHYDREEPAAPADLVLFVKTMPNAGVGHGQTATLRPPGEFHFEGELGVVIGERCRAVSADRAMEYVVGYTCVDELTNKGVPESRYDVNNRIRSKSFDDSCPVGPAVASPAEVPDDATLETRVNGEVEQHDSIANLIHSVPALLEEISRYLTLEPGDIVATGSPEGVDRLSDGDRVEVEIDGVGTLAHDVSIPRE